jgi:type I site-specific restriction-modification system R (restriction) subunit
MTPQSLWNITHDILAALAHEILQLRLDPSPQRHLPLFALVVLVVDRIQLALQLFDTVCHYFRGSENMGTNIA